MSQQLAASIYFIYQSQSLKENSEPVRDIKEHNTNNINYHLIISHKSIYTETITLFVSLHPG